MNVYIFAIGGTGARVLRSLSFCLASGMKCIPDGTHFVPIIIDYDKNNGDKKRCIDNLETYTRLRDAAYRGYTPNPDERNFFMPSIDYLGSVGAIPGKADVNLKNSFEFDFGLGATGGSSFADTMDYSLMMGNTALTKDLLAALYNDENANAAFTELNLDLTVGFKGNPNIGSIVFENLKNSTEFSKFKAAFNPAQDRVFVISSIFGGTGSSGFPRIIDAIRNSGIAGWDTVPIGAALVMPYFKVNTPAGGAIFSNIFNSKEKSALLYYGKPDANGKTLFDKVTTSYFVGDDAPTTLPYAEGDGAQANAAHYVELLSALAVIDFVTTPANGFVGQKEYGLASNLEGEKITLKNTASTDSKYYDHLVQMALSFRYYEEWLKSERIKSNETFYRGLDMANDIAQEPFYADLEKYIDDFNLWLDEMDLQTDAFKPFLQQAQDETRDLPIADDLNDYLTDYSAPTGGFFRSGVSYKDFTTSCSKHYHDDNWEGTAYPFYAFLAICYDSSAEALSYFV